MIVKISNFGQKNMYIILNIKNMYHPQLNTEIFIFYNAKNNCKHRKIKFINSNNN